MLNRCELVVVDASCLIVLDKIGQTKLLQSLFKTIRTTSTVALEAGTSLPSWVIVQDPRESVIPLRFKIDEGEASAIRLALEIKGCLIILDDQRARKASQYLGLQTIGTLGVILEAKDAGLVGRVSALIEKIRATNFRYSESLVREIIDLAGE